MGNIKVEQKTMDKSMTDEIAAACDDYRKYVKNILLPASQDLHSTVAKQEALLHQVYGINLVTAHSIDYLLAIKTAATGEKGRTALVKQFDDLYSVPGAHIRNRKMELIDAINNGIKHIRLNEKRYQEVIRQYGAISFQSLVQHDGRVLCLLENYRFDYCRVVLMPALSTLVREDLKSNEDVFAFAMGDVSVCDYDEEMSYASYRGYGYDEDDPIDQMIEMCNPPCVNCRESEGSCICSEYKFDGKPGEFEPMFTPSADEIDHAMSQISPSWRRS